jgi:hypothetical protein
VISNFKDNQDIKILIERARELSIDIAVANEREFSKRFESHSSKSRIKNFLRIQINKLPFLYRLLIKVKSFLN